ncbi:pyrroloquinoline quinone precursor peptide PqqA [Nocardia sp. CDC159]|uniref:Coenzyme PQQ synthesis protein A n=1 Tax=Nocardia pulmonis TaxID=2951408 RepID=A0A9X2EI45_9NOCA|nr:MULTISPECIES: pyrroloquinoline quinone precursor peptide PqqA [Nocardia]MCM6778648.1 pyrroloquinoline quinone precursor peptide PqqA [Nocardia pulmonis]MCM6791537.1 pyrroloquinoline quinone precursor peptide PqqA [Nocardia sp. CDC159]
MQATGSNRTVVEDKKPWQRPDFEFYDTGMEVTAYSARN